MSSCEHAVPRFDERLQVLPKVPDDQLRQRHGPEASRGLGGAGDDPPGAELGSRRGTRTVIASVSTSQRRSAINSPHRDADYRAVRALGDEYRKRNPRSIC
jgi:hypothetical protein